MIELDPTYQRLKTDPLFSKAVELNTKAEMAARLANEAVQREGLPNSKAQLVTVLATVFELTNVLRDLRAGHGLTIDQLNPLVQLETDNKLFFQRTRTN